MLINIDEAMDFLSVKHKGTFRKYKVPFRLWHDNSTKAYDSEDLEQHCTEKSSRRLPIKSELEKKKDKNLPAKMDMSLAEKLYHEIINEFTILARHKKLSDQANMLANSMCTNLAQRSVLELMIQQDPKDQLATKLYNQNMTAAKMLAGEKERMFNI